MRVAVPPTAKHLFRRRWRSRRLRQLPAAQLPKSQRRAATACGAPRPVRWWRI